MVDARADFSFSPRSHRGRWVEPVAVPILGSVAFVLVHRSGGEGLGA